MTAYYNDTDPYCADWLRNLIKEGHIADGDVDTRSIEDVLPSDLVAYTQCHFFAGIGVWSYALRLAGWPDERPVWTGSCPCQPFSAAGKGAGFDDERHLWPAWFHLIRECRPRVVFGEQVAAAIGHGWLDLACDDLEAVEYAVGATVLEGFNGRDHGRARVWFVADADSASKNTWAPGRKQSLRHVHRRVIANGGVRRIRSSDGLVRATEPGAQPLAYGIARRMDMLRAYGNAINAEAARTFVEAYLAGCSL